MTVFEKIFFCFILLSTGAESENYTKKVRRQYDFNPASAPPFTFYSGLEEGQGTGQVQALSTTPPQKQQQNQELMWKNQWTSVPPARTNPPQTPPPPPPTTTTPLPLFRQLPLAATRRLRTTTPATTPSTTTRRTRRKFSRDFVDTPDSIADKSRDLISQRDRTIAHITANLQPYFMRAVVHDFLTRLKNTTQTFKVLLASNEVTALNNNCLTCSVPQLQSLLTILLTIMEKYPPLNEDETLAGHVATEFERAADYLNRKLEQLRTDVASMRYDSDFRDIQKRYARRERKGGMMSILFKWFEDYVRNGHDNQADIQERLLKHLAKQKRYWLISVRGVL